MQHAGIVEVDDLLCSSVHSDVLPVPQRFIAGVLRVAGKIRKTQDSFAEHGDGMDVSEKGAEKDRVCRCI